MNLSISQEAKNTIKEQIEKHMENNDEEIVLALYQYFTRS